MPEVKNVYEMSKISSKKIKHSDVRHFKNVKKKQKSIHIAKYMYKNPKKVNMFPKSVSGTSPKPFTKESIKADIERNKFKNPVNALLSACKFF